MSSRVGGDRSANWTTTTAQNILIFYVTKTINTNVHIENFFHPF